MPRKFDRDEHHLRRHGSHGLVPCPDCGGNVSYGRSVERGGTGQYHCDNCRKSWTDDEVSSLIPSRGPCPSCGSEDTAPYDHSKGYGEGASQCHSCGNCWSLGEGSPEKYEDPDKGGDSFLPSDWK